MRPLLLTLLLSLAGCARCGSSAAPDAAVTLTVLDAGERMPAPRATADLRTAIIVIYPEYRGTALLQADATLERTVPGLTDALRDEALKALHFEPAEDGGWAFSTFHLSQPEPQVLRVTVSYDVEHLAQLYVAPTGLNSMELGQYLPRQLVPSKERLTFDVRYVSSAERSRELVRQATQLLLTNGQWSWVTQPAEWLDGSVPDASEVAVLKGPLGAVVRFERTGGRVFAQYALDTR